MRTILTPDECVEKHGYHRGPALGGGGFARVFSITNDPTKVIKITTDVSDARVAELARRKQDEGLCKNLVRVFNVWRCDDWRGETFVMVCERLERIPEEAKEYLPSYERLIDTRCRDVIELPLIANLRPFIPPFGGHPPSVNA
jgi:transcriptional regulator of met regulon